ncbi:hypothetical protein RR46_04733 [Papilio xuthus]|uniref:Uncharacterized protein n=1 Tax=Papilio xuthus TaxID=66420 RepID=A0A194Q420_PAPXU|nr:hypothetical protein RR46_04733 [Papilio xuthus]
MLRVIVFSLFLYSFGTCYPHLFETKHFKVGIEYDRSLPMSGGSDRYRHRNNYDPFFVTVTASAKYKLLDSRRPTDHQVSTPPNLTRRSSTVRFSQNFLSHTAVLWKSSKGYVMSYLEVSATTDALADVKFELIRGKTGSRNMVFQLVSNHSDFLAYSYMAYGIREEEYKKVTSVSLGSG